MEQDDTLERPAYGRRVWDPISGYDLVARVYERWHWRQFWLRNEVPTIAKLLRHHAVPLRCLDVGCGDGEYLPELAKLSPVIGVDPSRGMLRLAAHRLSPRISLIQARARALPLRTESVDIALAARSLSHELELVHAFDELARVCRPGGIVIVSDVHSEHNYSYTRIPLNGEDVYIETFKRNPAEICKVVKQLGCWDVEFEQTYCWQDLKWQPTDRRFFRIDKTGRRPVFFVMQLRRRHTSQLL